MPSGFFQRDCCCSVARCRVFPLDLGVFEPARVIFRGMDFLGDFLGFFEICGVLRVFRQNSREFVIFVLKM